VFPVAHRQKLELSSFSVSHQARMKHLDVVNQSRQSGGCRPMPGQPWLPWSCSELALAMPINIQSPLFCHNWPTKITSPSGLVSNFHHAGCYPWLSYLSISVSRLPICMSAKTMKNYHFLLAAQLGCLCQGSCPCWDQLCDHGLNGSSSLLSKNPGLMPS
jgi:hypothetical protein